MRIAIYTLTRDRLEYTKHCFAVLREKAGYPFDHYVVDNGSRDGTGLWLIGEHTEKRIRAIRLNGKNEGIARGCNQAIETILSAPEPYDLIIKFDNDSEVVNENILSCVVNVYEQIPEDERDDFILAPRDEGIVKQQPRHEYYHLGGWRIGRPTMVGGRFMVVPAEIYKTYRFPDTIPLARGADSALSHWHYKRSGRLGYIEDLVVNHYETTDGQARRYPEYFARKREEEKA